MGEAPHAASTGAPSSALPDLDRQTGFCRLAEAHGIDSVLLNFGYCTPDPILLAGALAIATDRIRFIIAHRSGLMSPTAFVQQANTLSALTGGRFGYNVVVGHTPEEQRYYGDFLSHDERYARTEEFLAVCHAFWRQAGPVDHRGRYYTIEKGLLETPFVSPDRSFPELYIGGGSECAQRLARDHGTCWLTIADAPDHLRAPVNRVISAGREVAIRASVVCRATTAQAVEAARAMAAERDPGRRVVRHTDSVSIGRAFARDPDGVEWITPYLWNGLVASRGAVALAFVGSPDDIAEAMVSYRRIGVTQIILSSWPKQEEMVYFGEEVIPRVRWHERRAVAS